MDSIAEYQSYTITKEVNYDFWEKDRNKTKQSVKKHPYKTVASSTDKQHAYGVNCIDSTNLQTYKFKH